MLPEKYIPITDIKNWIFNINPAYYYMPFFTGFLIIKPNKGSELCELLFYPKRGLLLSFGRYITANHCARMAAKWCLQTDQNRFLPSSTDETEDAKKKRREKRKRKKIDLTESIEPRDEYSVLGPETPAENSAPIPKMASSGAQSGTLAIFEEMRHGVEKKMIFHESKTSYILIYRKIRDEIQVVISKLEGEGNPKLATGTYTGSPVFVVSILKDMPKVLETISYSYFRLPVKTIWNS
jgi:hypothetical protein